MTTEQKIIRSQRVEIDKILKRLMVAEQRVAELEDNQLFLEQEQGWQTQDLKEIQKKFEVLEQRVSSIKMEKMIFDNP